MILRFLPVDGGVSIAKGRQIIHNDQLVLLLLLVPFLLLGPLLLL